MLTMDFPLQALDFLSELVLDHLPDFGPCAFTFILLLEALRHPQLPFDTNQAVSNQSLLSILLHVRKINLHSLSQSREFMNNSTSDKLISDLE